MYFRNYRTFDVEDDDSEFEVGSGVARLAR